MNNDIEFIKTINNRDHKFILSFSDNKEELSIIIKPMDSFFYEYISKLQVKEENIKMAHIFFTTHVKNIHDFLMDSKCICEIKEQGNQISAVFKLETQISGQTYKFTHSIILSKYEKNEKDAINQIYFKSERIIGNIYQQMNELKKENDVLKELMKSSESKKIEANFNCYKKIILSLQQDNKNLKENINSLNEKVKILSLASESNEKSNTKKEFVNHYTYKTPYEEYYTFYTNKSLKTMISLDEFIFIEDFLEKINIRKFNLIHLHYATCNGFDFKELLKNVLDKNCLLLIITDTLGNRFGVFSYYPVKHNKKEILKPKDIFIFCLTSKRFLFESDEKDCKIYMQHFKEFKTLYFKIGKNELNLISKSNILAENDKKSCNFFRLGTLERSMFIAKEIEAYTVWKKS